jgi:tRNA modification GTPase
VSGTAVSPLTPPGAGAIATVEVRGPRAWELARELFRPAGRPLPDAPEVGRFWFGTLGRDEVVLAATAPDAVEVHCHGGRRVVGWVIEQFAARGCTEERTHRPPAEGFVCARAAELLPHAPTLRTASILLDQAHGAFANEVRRILALLESHPPSAQEPLRRLAELGDTVGRHLVEPWKVVIAGPPNVGKSSLVNALAGYQRAVVSEIAGTTRDAVSVRTAFDGWPVELIDTAGLRDAEGLEAEGIERARREFAEAHSVVWVFDSSAPELEFPTEARATLGGFPLTRGVWAMNKCDRSVWPDNFPVAAIPVSALTGHGLPLLTARIVSGLIPQPPLPGSAVPFSAHLLRLVEAAHNSLSFGRTGEATWFLQESLAEAE